MNLLFDGACVCVDAQDQAVHDKVSRRCEVNIDDFVARQKILLGAVSYLMRQSSELVQ